MQNDVEEVRRTYQESVITEFATLAIACASVEAFLGIQMIEVTLRGEGPDYWLEGELLLEVSGHQNRSLKSLHETKLAQLLRNPRGKDGYVCVVSYKKDAARFWFHPYEG